MGRTIPPADPRWLVEQRTLAAGSFRLAGVRLLRHLDHGDVDQHLSRCLLRTTYTRGDWVGRRGADSPYHESAQSALAAVEDSAPHRRGADPLKFAALLDRLGRAARRIRGKGRHRSGADGLGDAALGRAAVPLPGPRSRQAPPTSMSIGIDRPEMTKQKVRSAPTSDPQDQGRARQR